LPAYLLIVRRRWAIVVVVALAAFGVALVAALLLPSRYQAQATVRVTPTAGASGAVDFDDATYANRLLNTYRLLVGGDAFRQELARTLQLESAPAVHASVPANSELLQLAVESSDADLAQRAANASADLLVQQVRDQAARTDAASEQAVQAQLERLQADVETARQALAELVRGTPEYQLGADRLSAARDAYGALLESSTAMAGANALRTSGTAVVSRALRPTTPSGLPRELLLAFGLVCGVAGGVGLAFLLHRLDRRLYAPGAISAAAGADALLGTIPAPNGSHPPATLEDDAFLRLVAVLSARWPYGVGSVLVAGAGAADGTWPVAERLARSLAANGRRVALVDGNLRWPAAGDGAADPPSPGLSDVLGGDATLDDALRREQDDGVSLLPAGSPAPDPGALLSSASARGLLQDLRLRFDAVVVHAPPLPAVADAALLAPSVDGVVLVARAGQVTAETMQRACEELDAVHAHRLGVLVTHAATVPSSAGGNGAGRP
jgi:capsular exopolysaccharide synthesis family protein